MVMESLEEYWVGIVCFATTTPNRNSRTPPQQLNIIIFTAASVIAVQYLTTSVTIPRKCHLAG